MIRGIRPTLTDNCGIRSASCFFRR